MIKCVDDFKTNNKKNRIHQNDISFWILVVQIILAIYNENAVNKGIINLFDCGGISLSVIFPTMKSLDADKKVSKTTNSTSEAAPEKEEDFL